jgi:predicted permease
MSIDEELRFHIDMQIEANLRAGMSPAEARRVALLEFGGVEQIKEECRDQRRWAWLEDLALDVRYGARMLRASPGFTAFALITIALCLGANAAIFSLIDGVLFKASGFRDPERIVFLWESAIKVNAESGVASGTFVQWRAESKSFEVMAAERSGTVLTYTGGGVPHVFATTKVSASYFDVFGTQAALGRTFARGEDETGRDQVVVLTHRTWQDFFGADPSLVGRSIMLDHQPRTVIGVLGADDRTARHKEEIFVPLVLPASPPLDDYAHAVRAKLKPGVTVAQARAELGAIAARTAERYAIKKGWGATVLPYLDVLGEDVRQSLWMLMAAVFVVLLIGCANLANLMLARATLRGREIAVRLAIGAGRARLIRMLLSESLLLATLGAAAGAVIGYGLLAWIQRLLPPDYLPAESRVAMDGRVLGFLAATTLLTTLIFGLMPALRAAGQDPNLARDEGGRGQTPGRVRVHARQIFIAIQVAIAFVLLVGGGLLLRSLERVMKVSPGFGTEGVVVAYLPLIHDGRERDPARLIRFVQRVVDEVRAEPGMLEVGVACGLPFSGWGRHTSIGVREDGEALHTGFKIVTPGYFRALGMRPLRGRLLDEGDRAGAARVVVVNESFVRRYLPDHNPVGQQITVRQILPDSSDGPAVPWQIVGLVADEKAEGLETPDDVGVYGSFEQSPRNFLGLVARGKGDPAALIQAAQRAVARVDPEQVLLWPKSLQAIKAEQIQPRRLITSLMGSFALLALLLAAAGTYAVVAFVTAARTHEFGIRAALGASRAHLLWQTMAGVATPVLVGTALGFAGALALSRVIASLLFATSPRDVPALLGTGALLVPIALLAALVPGWRAVRANPLTALRQD